MDGAWECETCDGYDALDDDEPLEDMCTDVAREYDWCNPVYDIGQHDLCNTGSNPGQCGTCDDHIGGFRDIVFNGRHVRLPIWDAACSYQACAERPRLTLHAADQTVTVTVTGALPDYPYRISYVDPTAPVRPTLPGAPPRERPSRTVRTNEAGEATVTFGYASCYRPTSPVASPAPVVATVSMTEAGIGVTRTFGAIALPIPRCAR